MLRMSSTVLYQKSIQDMQMQQIAIAKLQSQISSNRKVLNPGDDPVAASREVGLDASRLFTEQMLRNQADADGRITQNATYIDQTTSIVQTFRTRVVAGNNATLSERDRNSLADELQEMRDQIFAIANVRDSNNHYIFSGFASETVSYVNVNGRAQYNGDNGVRQVQVSSNLNMPINLTGAALFEGISARSGVYSTPLVNTNRVTFTTEVTNQAAYDAWNSTQTTAPFNVQFLDNAGNYEVLDNSGAVIGTGTVPATGGTIAITDGGVATGISMTFSGLPAQNDEFRVNTTISVFDIMDDAILALRQPDGANAGELRTTMLLQSLNLIDQTIDRLGEYTSLMGARQNQLDSLKTQDTANKDNYIAETVRLTGMTPEDQVAAISELTLRNLSLEAGRQLYANISKNSLFNYI